MITTIIECSCGKKGDMIYTCETCHPKKLELGWQKCPVCNGSGSDGLLYCSICNGEKIINITSALPPSKHNK